MLRKTLPRLLIFIFLATLSCTPWPRPAQESLSSRLARAAALAADRRYSEAITVLEVAAQTFPTAPLPLIKLGQIYLTQHRWLLAEDAFNRALARDLNEPLALAGLAETLFNQNRFDRSLQLWRQLVDARPDFPGALTGLGRTYLWLFNFEAAREAFLSQQAYGPEPEAQWYLAAMEAPRDLAAGLDYLRAIPSVPQEAGAGLAAQRDYLLAALAPFSAESSRAEVAKATGIALAQVQLWPLAVHALTIAQESGASTDAEVLAFLGYALAQAGRPALDLFDQAQQADPDSALPLYFRGLYLRQQGALKAAEALFGQAVELDPENAALRVELANTEAEQGNLGIAETLYRAAIEVAGDDIQFQLLLVRFYANHGYRLAEAGIPAAEAIIEKDGTNAEAYDLLGWMQFQTGAAESGETALRRALELDPDLISARYHLARQLEAQGQDGLALAEYQRVIDRDTSGIFRERALKAVQRINTE